MVVSQVSISVSYAAIMVTWARQTLTQRAAVTQEKSKLRKLGITFVKELTFLLEDSRERALHQRKQH